MRSTRWIFPWCRQRRGGGGYRGFGREYVVCRLRQPEARILACTIWRGNSLRRRHRYRRYARHSCRNGSARAAHSTAGRIGMGISVGARTTSLAAPARTSALRPRGRERDRQRAGKVNRAFGYASSLGYYRERLRISATRVVLATKCKVHDDSSYLGPGERRATGPRPQSLGPRTWNALDAIAMSHPAVDPPANARRSVNSVGTRCYPTYKSRAERLRI